MAISTSRDLFPDGPSQHKRSRSIRQSRPAPSTARSIVEWVVVVVGAVLVALIIKTFLVQAFYIPSESMLPTLQKDDRVLVNKVSYRLHPINRGDIVVFERPEEPPAGDSEDQIKDLIKRVIALPGEKVVFQDHKVYIDGKPLAEPYLPANADTEDSGTLKCNVSTPCVVPPNSVWVMGDNRKNSRDSRYMGAISEDKIVGRAFVVIWPLSRFSGI